MLPSLNFRARLAPLLEKQHAKAKAVRKEIAETTSVSDVYLSALLLVGSAYAHKYIHSTRDLWTALIVYVLLFIGWMLLKERDRANRPPLQTYLNKLD